jgi:hypothetical protein
MDAKFRSPTPAGLLDVATHAGPAASPGDRACCCAAPSAAHARVKKLRASWVAPGAWFDDHDQSAHVVAHAVAVARLLRGTLAPGIAGFRPWFAGPGNRTFELVEYVP